MLVANGGDFKQVEMHVKKWMERKQTSESVEADVTKTMLKETYKWSEPGSYPCSLPCICDRSMITTAWAWAKANKKLFTSEIHGEEYISVNVESFRRRVDERGMRMDMQSRTEFEALFSLAFCVC